MATREELYKQFGPILIESLILIIRDEINILRTNAGMTERTNQQIIDAIDSKLQTIQSYDWMNNNP